MWCGCGVRGEVGGGRVGAGDLHFYRWKCYIVGCSKITELNVVLVLLHSCRPEDHEDLPTCDVMQGIHTENKSHEFRMEI